MTAKEFRERLARAEKALEKVPGYWEVLEVSFVRSGGSAPMRLRIIADGPKSEEELKETFGTGGWAWRLTSYQTPKPYRSLGTKWKALEDAGLILPTPVRDAEILLPGLDAGRVALAAVDAIARLLKELDTGDEGDCWNFMERVRGVLMLAHALTETEEEE